MKLLFNGLMVACLLVTLSGATAFGSTRKSNITFSTDTKVNGMLVKKGEYGVVFDDQSGELSIFKGAKLIAKTSARIEKRDQKARWELNHFLSKRRFASRTSIRASGCVSLVRRFSVKNKLTQR